MEKSELKFLGYVSFYIALFFENDGQAVITKFEADFRKSITEEFVLMLVDNAKAYYEYKFGLKATSIQFVSREAYEEFCKEYPDAETNFNMHWENNKCYINDEEINIES